jgi:hypothetical protein
MPEEEKIFERKLFKMFVEDFLHLYNGILYLKEDKCPRGVSKERV